MTREEFYENYWLVDGKKPPPLTEFDRKVFQAYDKMEKGEYENVVVIRGRGTKRTLMAKLNEGYNKLPEFLKP